MAGRGIRPRAPAERAARRGDRRRRAGGGRGRGRDRARQRPPRRTRGVGGVRPGGDLELRRHRPVRVARAAGEPRRPADGAAGLRLGPVHARRRQRGVALHDRARHRRPVGRRLPAPGAGLPHGPAPDPARPRARDRRLHHLPARVRARAAVLGPGRAQLPGLPHQRPADPAGRRPGRDPDRRRRARLRRAVRRRAAARAAALAGHQRVRAAAARAPCTCARSGRSCSSRWPAPAAATSPSGPRSSPPR